MVFKGLIAATAAIALSATPALAQANASAATAVAPATETVEGSEMFGRGGFIIPLLAIVAVALGIWILLDDDEDDLPASP